MAPSGDGTPCDLLITRHPMPLLAEERSVEAWANFHESYGAGYEKIFVSEPAPGVWKVVNIPYHVYGLKLRATVRIMDGQIVAIDGMPDENPWRIQFRSMDARQAALRDPRFERIAYVEPMFDRFVGVQARHGNDEDLKALLSEWARDGAVEAFEDVMAEVFDPGPILEGGIGTDFRVWDPGLKDFVSVP